MAAKRLDPIPPGEILLEEFMRPLDISQNRLGRELGVPIGRIHEIVHGQRSISVDTALRLARFFGTTPEFWMNLQLRFDLEVAERGPLPEALEKSITPLQEKPVMRSKRLDRQKRKQKTRR